MCESCGLKQPNFGLLVEGKARWCAGCTNAGVEKLKYTAGSSRAQAGGSPQKKPKMIEARLRPTLYPSSNHLEIKI
jgi:hypothetical protein